MDLQVVCQVAMKPEVSQVPSDLELHCHFSIPAALPAVTVSLTQTIDVVRRRQHLRETYTELFASSPVALPAGRSELQFRVPWPDYAALAVSTEDLTNISLYEGPSKQSKSLAAKVSSTSRNSPPRQYKKAKSSSEQWSVSNVLSPLR